MVSVYMRLLPGNCLSRPLCRLHLPLFQSLTGAAGPSFRTIPWDHPRGPSPGLCRPFIILRPGQSACQATASFIGDSRYVQVYSLVYTPHSSPLLLFLSSTLPPLLSSLPLSHCFSEFRRISPNHSRFVWVHFLYLEGESKKS